MDCFRHALLAAGSTIVPRNDVFFICHARANAVATFVFRLCTFASLKYQMLSSVIPMQAWLRRSLFAFVIRPVEDQNLHVGFGEDFLALFHAERIESVRRFVGNPSGIDEANFSPVQKQADFDKVTGRAGDIAHQDAVFAEERIHET